MANFMTNKHIINIIRRQLPHWECQNTSFHIELCRFYCTILNNDVLCGKELGEL